MYKLGATPGCETSEMTSDPVLLLSANASAQVLVSSLLGAAMLIPMQPWAAGLKAKVNLRALLSTHLDWLMLAFMQWGAAVTMMHWPVTRSLPTAVLLIAGGWANALPYLFRAFGINAFAMTGGLVQRAAAALSGLSSTAIIAAWGLVCWRIARGP
jgi:hypothetical protein